MCVRERGGYLYSHVSGGKFYFEKIIAIFPGAKTTTCTGESFHTIRATKQTYIPTYMHQKILSCNKLDNIGEMLLKYAVYRGRALFGCLI